MAYSPNHHLLTKTEHASISNMSIKEAGFAFLTGNLCSSFSVSFSWGVFLGAHNFFSHFLIWSLQNSRQSPSFQSHLQTLDSHTYIHPSSGLLLTWFKEPSSTTTRMQNTSIWVTHTRTHTTYMSLKSIIVIIIIIIIIIIKHLYTATIHTFRI